MDSAIHRDARARLARRVPAHRPWPQKSAERNQSQETARRRRIMAPVACICCHAFMDQWRRHSKGTTMQLNIGHLSSPIGTLTLAWDDAGLRALDFHGFEDRFQRLLASHYGACELNTTPIPALFRHPIEAYFAGDFSLLDLIPTCTNGTRFQQQVWAALREIPAGTTLSYGALASKIGKPNATRAVGRANGANPIGIVVP